MVRHNCAGAPNHGKHLLNLTPTPAEKNWPGFPHYFPGHEMGWGSPYVGVPAWIRVTSWGGGVEIWPGVPPYLEVCVVTLGHIWPWITPYGVGGGGVVSSPVSLSSELSLSLCAQPEEVLSMMGDKTECIPVSNSTSASLHLCDQMRDVIPPRGNTPMCVPTSFNPSLCSNL